MDNLNLKFDEWCRRIAESRSLDDLIKHFREHVNEHYERHNRKGKVSLDIWLIGVLNFMHILEKKCPYITTEDMLFKLCTYHENHEGGPDAPFDVDKFIEEYGGEIKKFHKYQSK
jgi:hypothetical protein